MISSDGVIYLYACVDVFGILILQIILFRNTGRIEVFKSLKMNMWSTQVIIVMCTCNMQILKAFAVYQKENEI